MHYIEDKGNTMVRTMLAEYDLPEDTPRNFTASLSLDTALHIIEP